MFEAAGVDTDPRLRKEAEALVAAGWDVTVLAWDRAGTSPDREERDGWRVESFGPRGAHGGGMRSVPGYRAYWRAAATRAAELAPDVLHCHDLDTVQAGLDALKALGDKPRLVLDFWEMYRESRALPQTGAAGAVARSAARWLERKSIPRADLVITVVEGQVEYYRGLGAKNVLVIENAPDLDAYTPVEHEPSETFTACFIGQKRYVPGLISLMLAVQRHANLHALIVGGGPAEAEIAAAAQGLERVDVRGRVDKSAIPALYENCDAVYAAYDTSLENWRTAFPVKVQEGMALGLPVVVSKNTWIAEYVAEHGLGVAVDDRDVDDVERALVSLASDRDAARAMGMRGRAIVERELNWDTVAARLVRAYEAFETESA